MSGITPPIWRRTTARLIASTFLFMDFPLDAEFLGLQGKARSTGTLVTQAEEVETDGSVPGHNR